VIDNVLYIKSESSEVHIQALLRRAGKFRQACFRQAAMFIFEAVRRPWLEWASSMMMANFRCGGRRRFRRAQKEISAR